MTTIPSDNFLTRVTWTQERAKREPYVTWRDDEPWIGDRKLITQDKVEQVLKSEWRKVPPSIGYLRWYSVLARKFVGVSRPAVEKFLANAEGKQLYRERRNIVSTRALISKKPGVIWTCDITFPGGAGAETKYRGKKCVGLFVIIDQHSKYIWASPVSSLDMKEMIRVTKQFLADIGPRSSRVKIVRSDNGFGAEYTEWCKEQGIRHSTGRPWVAAQQGAVERGNKTINSLLMSQAIYRLGSKKRWPELVEGTVDLINDSWSRILLKTPREVFEGEGTDPKILDRIKQEGGKRKWSSLYEDQPLAPGDWVRVSLRATGPSAVKARIKAGTYKGYLQQWSSAETTRVGENDIRQVKRKIRPETYELTDGSKFDRADLLKVPGPNPLKE
jgi:transposase InsO family protein